MAVKVLLDPVGNTMNIWFYEKIRRQARGTVSPPFLKASTGERTNQLKQDLENLKRGSNLRP